MFEYNKLLKFPGKNHTFCINKKDDSLLKCFVSCSVYVTAFSQGVCQHAYFSATSVVRQNIPT